MNPSKKSPRRPSAPRATFLRDGGLLLWLVLFLHAAVLTTADHSGPTIPSRITLKSAVIPGNTFGGFQRDLLKRLELFALEDNVTLEFQTTQVQTQYGANLDLISPDCHAGEEVVINNVSYACGEFDMIVGDYWTNPKRYEKIDFTPPWLHTSISTIKYVEKTKYPLLDITTLTEATVTGAGVCAMQHSPLTKYATDAFPRINIVPCNPTNATDGCITMLKNEECALWVSDELVLRKRQADDPSLGMTGEHLKRQLLAWPVRKSLDPTISFLLNKWMYAAISNQTIDELYFEYFEKKLCPIGTSGKHCELPCDPDHGMSNAHGKCVCESTRWTGEDCSIEVPEDLNMIPFPLKIVAYLMLGINVLVISVCGAWLFTHWSSSQVQASQPTFLMLVLLGCLISSSTILAFAEEDEGDGYVPACMAIPWLYSVGFSITFGTLFAKIRRVYKIFTQQHATPPQTASSFSTTGRNPVTAHDTIFCIGAVLLLDIVILSLWTALDPLEWHRVVLREDQFGDPLSSQGYCCSSSWKLFSGLIAGFHLGLLAMACFMCYAARNIPTKYQEGKYVSMAMLSNLQLFLLGVPVLIIVGGDPAASFFVRSVIIWMNDLVVVALIFCPLMHSVHLSSSNPSKGSTVAEKDKVKEAVRHYAFDRTNESGNRSHSKIDGNKKETAPSKAREVSPPIHLPSPPPSPPFKGNRDRVSSLTDCSFSKKSVSFNEQVFISEYELELGASEDDDTETDEHAAFHHEQSDRFSNERIQGTPSKPSRCSTLVDEPTLIVPPQQDSEPSTADAPSVWSSTGSGPSQSKEDHNTGPPQMPRRPPSPVDDASSFDGDSSMDWHQEQPAPQSPSSPVVPSPSLPHQDPILGGTSVPSKAEETKADVCLEGGSSASGHKDASVSVVSSQPEKDTIIANSDRTQTKPTPIASDPSSPLVPNAEPECVVFLPISQPSTDASLPRKSLPPSGETVETMDDSQSTTASF